MAKKFFVFGLGNPGKEYELSRHNAGKQAVAKLGSLSIDNLKFIESGEYMNHSGKAVSKIIKSKKAAGGLIIIYDDMDLPIGTFKISYNKSSGGHRGLESVIKTLKTKEFIRIRIGISPTTQSGKIKKHKGEKKVLDFILSNFKPTEMKLLTKVFKQVSGAISTIVLESLEMAMNRYN